MAMTSEDVQNQSFSIARKGYDVDEVDVFLERVADELDDMNSTIAQLEEQLDEAAAAPSDEDDPYAGFDTPATIDPLDDDLVDDEDDAQSESESAVSQEAEEADGEKDAEDAAKGAADAARVIAEKDARIAELEEMLAEKQADDSAISQALIIAQRSADEIIATAKGEAADIVANARAERERILDKAEGERQKVQDAIDQLEESREDIRGDYQDMLTDLITDASRRLAEIGGTNPVASAHARLTPARIEREEEPARLGVMQDEPAEMPILESPMAYTLPQDAGATAASEPVASTVEKDFSGFGDSDDFEFDEID